MRPIAKKNITITISTIITLVILLHILGILSPLEELLRRISYPISDKIYTLSVSIEGEEQQFSSVEELRAAYTNISHKYRDQQVINAEVALLQEENKQLREQLSFFQQNTLSHTGADVIGKNIEPLSRSIILNKGYEHGVQEGDAVIVNNGIFVGVVMKSNQRTSIVRLINDNQSTIGATVINKEQSIGLIEGGFGVSVRMKFIPQNELISIGDIIVTSGLNDSIPKGLAIGTIEIVEKEVYQPFQEAIVTPLVDLDKITVVSIITSPSYDEPALDTQ